MTICMDELLRCLTTALDAVEGDLLGASTNHGKRIATLCIAMGKHLGMSEDELTSLAACAMLHDNALTEYILSERPGKGQQLNMRLHCEYGQRNVNALPFRSNVKGFVLYHHEHADGSGAFGKKEGEYPLGAALIAMADMLDASLHLQRLSPQNLPALRENIASRAGVHFTKLAAETMLAVLDEDMLRSLKDENILFTVAASMPCWAMSIEDEAIIRLASLSARIIDYKSRFTRTHSVQIANKAWHMSGYYQMNASLRAQIYLAASLHDLGKLYVPTDILEKPGALNAFEFDTIKSHVWWTHEMLSEISGLENLCRWASNHHEKLDGSGYPNGFTGKELDFISRLMACIDIYQAVTEARPYHQPRAHANAMPILQEMAADGKIDPAIVQDIHLEMAKFPTGNLPSPPGALV